MERGGLTGTGGANISGSGLLIYNAGSNYPSSVASSQASLSAAQEHVSLSAPTSGPDAGVLIFQSHQNTLDMSLRGSAMTGLNGTIYAPGALLSLIGGSQL